MTAGTIDNRSVVQRLSDVLEDEADRRSPARFQRGRSDVGSHDHRADDPQEKELCGRTLQVTLTDKRNALCPRAGLGRARRVKAIMGRVSSIREIAADAARNAELMEKAQFITGKTVDEIRALAACSPLRFADFVQGLPNSPLDTRRTLVQINPRRSMPYATNTPP